MFEGKLVRLREYRKEDIPVKLSYINDPEVLQYLEPGIPYPVTLNEEMKWLDSLSAFKDTYRFAIETISDSKYIGDCGVNSIDWKNGVARVSIFIGNNAYRGKGYGTEAMKLLVCFVFDQMNANKISLSVYSFNVRAIRSYDKCGFRTEGMMRREIFRNGEYHDVVVMGMLRDEYEAMKDRYTI